jgi:hypothetical protein
MGARDCFVAAEGKVMFVAAEGKVMFVAAEGKLWEVAMLLPSNFLVREAG